ncbi:MAG TPA: thioredoxin family protein [Syntrophomonadaceae bacterium]|jgi:thioredoxin-like negative regulator of GroEL|nr:thioredoxin family protein [Syntrophomonadaceae bacterium]HOQ09040.1 thioredoxin family protein [Syntrophomonadaceae bacterium]HPU47962.1 thioredoxin family protein [Syntrophomonadaceae bacterium]
MLNRRTLILVAITVVLIGLIFFSNRPDPEENQANDGAAVQIDRVLQEGQPAWLLFRTSTCPACAELKETFDRLQPEYEGKVVFIDINLDVAENYELGREYRIGYVPQTYIINSAGEITYRMVGNTPEEELRRELDRVAVKKP